MEGRQWKASFRDMPTDGFFKAWLETSRAAVRQAWADTRVVLDKVTTVDSKYSFNSNQIAIFAPMLLHNLFLAEGPPAFNYARLGSVLGHEIMHAYDVRGSQFDDNAENRSWFSPESKKEYMKKVLCLRNFHKTVKLANNEVLNDEADSENLADLVGTRMAYSAFSALHPSERDTTLHGVAMTANQLFFINYCAEHCATSTPQISVDLHADSLSRCIVPLMNMDEFSDAFSCPNGSHMNPPNKCTFWT
nr:endothelin-converting enzyme homolog [Dermacentor andersoni]